MNIILIIADTLRYDFVGANGNDWIITPNMDRLAAKSWVFDRAYTASFPTIPHRKDVITGRYGSPFNVWGPLPFDVPTLPRALAEHGYCTQLIHDTPHLVNGGHNFDWPFHGWEFVRGAEVDRRWMDDGGYMLDGWTKDPQLDFVDAERMMNRPINAYIRTNRKRKVYEDWNAAQVFLRGSDFLKSNQTRDKFFLWVDSFDPHEPWDTPPEFVKMYDKTPGYDGRIDPRIYAMEGFIPEVLSERLKNLYAAKVTWMDHWLGKFLDTFESTGLAKNTALIFTSDHGTQVGEMGSFGKNWPVREAEGHVPFFVYAPGAGSGRCDAMIQPQDVFATVMSLAGLETPQELDSHDLLAIAKGAVNPPRPIAISSTSMDGWQKDGPGPVFTLFDHEWCLEAAAKPENCRLWRLGTLKEVAAENQDVVRRLHAAALNEMERRGTHPALMKWMRSGMIESEFPTDCSYCDGWPSPVGYEPYFNFNRQYRGK
ncbi:MAG: sulfatase [bacterium]